MFKNHLKVAFRYLYRNRAFTLINIAGLAVGLAACFAILQYVHFERSYDQFHRGVENIYRVTLEWDKIHMATNHPAAGPTLKSDIPEVAEYARMAPISLFTNSVTLTYIDDKGVRKSFNEDRIYLVDSTFFTLFSFPFIYGNPKAALPTGNSIVITKSLAEKFFGPGNPLGKELLINGFQRLMVSGVTEDVPENSHIKFNVLALLSLGDYNMSWEWPEYYTYVRLVPGTDPGALQAKLKTFASKYLGETIRQYHSTITLHLQPVTDIYLKSQHLDKEREVRGNEKTVYFMIVIGVLILVIAWINYINLSTSKSLERAREVGMRKIVGASKPQVIRQFLFESLIINLIALLLAFILLVFFLPYFNQLAGKNIGSTVMDLSLFSEPLFWVALIGIILFGTLLAGGYPALVVSSFKSSAILKGKFFGTGSGIRLRQLLVGIQFAISIGLIAGTLVVFRQVSYMRNNDLGYVKNQLLVIKTPTVVDSTVFNKNEAFRNELTRNRNINYMTLSSEIPGRLIPLLNGIRIKGEDIKENFHCYMISIKPDFIETFGLKILAGREFRENEQTNPYGNNVNPVIINEKAMTLLGFKLPEECVNQFITFKFGPQEREGEIIGVVNNYHQRSLKDDYDPLLFLSSPFYDAHYYILNIHTDHIGETVKFIQSKYDEIFPGNPFEYFFQDEYFNRQYAADQKFGNVFGVFSIIAILVACLGLYGLSMFLVVQRTKEIAIRKVLGANFPSMLVLLSGDFIKLILLANLVALPVIVIYANNWLKNFAFHVPMGWVNLVIPTGVILLVSFIATSSQTIKTALANPAVTLKYE